MTTVTIKRGTIELPARMRRRWDDGTVVLHDHDDRLILERPRAPQKIDLQAWMDARGILRGRKIPDAGVWQRKIRTAWERELP